MIGLILAAMLAGFLVGRTTRGVAAYWRGWAEGREDLLPEWERTSAPDWQDDTRLPANDPELPDAWRDRRAAALERPDLNAPIHAAQPVGTRTAKP
jgi:NADH:ubiquinone oxidoreductase subunit